MNSKRIYAILAHYDKNSLSHALFQATTTALSQEGYVVDTLDLYARADEIPFYVSSHPDAQPTLHSSSFFHENKERFLASDGLIIVYPIFWYATPGILKCWIDLITNFAWSCDKKGNSKGLHTIQKAFVINSSMESWWHRKFLTSNPSRRQLEGTFDFMKIPNYHFYEIGSTHKMTQEQKHKHEAAIIKRCINFFK